MCRALPSLPPAPVLASRLAELQEHEDGDCASRRPDAGMRTGQVAVVSSSRRDEESMQDAALFAQHERTAERLSLRACRLASPLRQLNSFDSPLREPHVKRYN